MESLQGQLLVASPHLRDDNFFRSVVLVLHHDEEGAFGLILNRATDISIEDIADQIQDLAYRSDQPIMEGGPVSGPLMALHAESRVCDNFVVPGLFFSTGQDELQSLLMMPDSDFRLYNGYSGWGGGQLEHELRDGGWLKCPATAQDVLTAPSADLWNQIRLRIGKRILAESLDIPSVPANPEVN